MSARWQISRTWPSVESAGVRKNAWTGPAAWFFSSGRCGVTKLRSSVLNCGFILAGPSPRPPSRVPRFSPAGGVAR